MPETFNYETQTVSILVHRSDGRHTTLNYSGFYDCSFSVLNDIAPNDEILLVTVGDKVVWSWLSDQRGLSRERVLHFVS